jgi:hypothetical protein
VPEKEAEEPQKKLIVLQKSYIKNILVKQGEDVTRCGVLKVLPFQISTIFVEFLETVTFAKVFSRSY